MNTEVNQEEKWRKLLLEFKTQDKTIKNFCELNDVRIHQFTYWRNKIEKGIVRKKKRLKSSFIKVATTNKNQSGNNVPFTIEVNNIKINVPINFNHLALTKLIKVVQAID